MHIRIGLIHFITTVFAGMYLTTISHIHPLQAVNHPVCKLFCTSHFQGHEVEGGAILNIYDFNFLYCCNQ